MSEGRTHYEILELAPEATADQVKKRFRELARRYHPDLHPNHPEFHEIFVRITQAYETLIDPIRRAHYDLNLRDQARRSAAGRAGAYGSAPFTPPRANPTPPPSGSNGSGGASARAGAGATDSGPAYNPRARREAEQRRQDVARLLDNARKSYQRGTLRDAEKLCQEVLKLARVGAAYEMLGDILTKQGREEEAIEQYTLAAQLQPSNGLIMSKLNRVAARVGASARVDPFQGINPMPRERIASYRYGVTCIGLVAIVLLMFARLDAHEATLPLPFVPHWTLSHLSFMGLDGLLAGLLLAVAGWVRPIDQELLYQTVNLGRRSLPLGLVLGVVGCVFFPGAVLLYLALLFLQGIGSRSVLTLFVITGLLILGFVVMGPPNSGVETLVFGGGVLFFGELCGWILGELFRPSWAG